MNRKWTWLALPLVGGTVGLSLFGPSLKSAAPAGAEPPKSLRPSASLPITRVVLFNSGVAHFTRSGDVEGNARVDLNFPEADINDLLKSMTLEDERGRVSLVNYDSRDPISKTLKSFAIDLNNAPTYSQILNQARGEQVEVALVQAATGQPATLTGKIIGVEKSKVPTGQTSIDVDVLNLWCAEGVRAVKLADVQRLRFTNPHIENEMKRALETLALSHDTLKKSVTIEFNGEGKRQARVGYVTENPIWKTSYRLVLDKKDGKPYLQGWGVVENPTDEDWSDVGMVLVSGRPISFKMDLYNPLYVGRPTVEPELFASLRPPTYGGALGMERELLARNMPSEPMPVPPGMPGLAAAAPGGFGAAAARDGGADYRRGADRKAAEQLAAGLDKNMNLGATVSSAATTSQLGEYFQYVVDQPVNLPRQKSALLPIIAAPVEADRVSIYNARVQAKHPLLGLRFKNTTGANMAQGPITVYEGSVYAGDTRVLDLQKGEERLVSYAIDLGVEVAPKSTDNSSRITKVRAVKGVIYTTSIQRQELQYDIANRATTDRVLLIEHPNSKGAGFTFVGDNKPAEEASDVFRFKVPVKKGESLAYKVTEERPLGSQIILTNSQDDQIRYVINLDQSSPELKAKLREALEVKAKWDGVRRDIQDVQTRLQTIERDQQRVRENLKATPKEAEVYGKYLKKLSEQEAELDTLHANLKSLQEAEAVSKKGYETFLTGITIE